VELDLAGLHIVLFHSGYDVSRICSLGPEKTRVHFDFFVDPEAGLTDDQKAATSKGVHDLVAEDTAISEAVHANLTSGVFPGGSLGARHEEGIAPRDGGMRVKVETTG